MPPTAIAPEPVLLSPSLRLANHRRSLALLTGLWLALFFASLWTPAILDDADGTHANAARQMLLSHDWVTLRVNNVRYLEKAPLPYWIVALSFRLFGFTAFAAHLPQALAVLGLALLGYRWGREAYGDRAGFYAALFTLTSAGVFLFSRIFIPDPLLSLLLSVSLYCFLKSIHQPPRPTRHPAERSEAPRLLHASGRVIYPYALWTALALAVLTKGLVAIIFLGAPAAVYLGLTGEYHNWRRLKPFSGGLLFLAIAVPWHVLAGLRNTGGMNGHGFFWFYFVNEHILRFVGRRIPRDYNKLPGYLYWSLHLVWLFPWSLFTPLVAVAAVRRWRHFSQRNPWQAHRAMAWLWATGGVIAFSLLGPHHKTWAASGIFILLLWFLSVRRAPEDQERDTLLAPKLSFRQLTTVLLIVCAAFVLLFFCLSTNQEYYTFPAYLPILILLAAAVARAEHASPLRNTHHRLPAAFTFAHATFTILGIAISAALGYGLWTSRHIPFVPDIGSLLAHRGVGDYTLSMSSLFDLTGPSFAALRLPATLALVTFALGPGIAWALRRRRQHFAATTVVALTSALFLIAAHIALHRFAPMLSSEDMAQSILKLEHSGQIAPDSTVLLFGDQAYGSSIGFYLDRPIDRPVLLVDAASSSMLFGSTFPDAKGLFLTPAQLTAQWGHGPRKILFVPIERRTEAERLLAPHHPVLLKETSGKLLLTDRPLNAPQ